MTRRRIAVLASGGGSNLQALLDYFSELGDRRSGDVVLVASERPDPGAFTRARAAGIATATLRSRWSPDGDDLLDVLDGADIELVVLAGYLQLIPPEVIRKFSQRIVNVHPAPLPAFGGPGMYGARVHRAVLAAGVATSGPTVHFVDEEYDHGAVIAHAPVPVLPGDDERTLAGRVLTAEHWLFPRVIDAIASGRDANSVQAVLGNRFE